MIRLLYQKTPGKTVCLACASLLLLGLAPVGCDGGDNAEAAADWTSQTFLIFPESFFLRTSSKPTITISDGATEYTLNSSGTVNFTETDGSARSMSLDSDEIIIERPGSGAVTVIQSL